MIAAGREVEDTLGQIGRWYGAVSDLNECQMAFKYDDLNDTNEVKLVSKIKKKDGFFEKFFNLFSK